MLCWSLPYEISGRLDFLLYIVIEGEGGVWGGEPKVKTLEANSKN